MWIVYNLYGLDQQCFQNTAWNRCGNTKEGFIPQQVTCYVANFPCDVLKNELRFRALIKKENSYAFIMLYNVMIKIIMLFRESKLYSYFVLSKNEDFN